MFRIMTASDQTEMGGLVARLDRMSEALNAISAQRFYMAYPIGFNEPVRVPERVEGFAKRHGPGFASAEKYLREWIGGLDESVLRRAAELNAQSVR